MKKIFIIVFLLFSISLFSENNVFQKGRQIKGFYFTSNNDQSQCVNIMKELEKKGNLKSGDGGRFIPNSYCSSGSCYRITTHTCY